MRSALGTEGRAALRMALKRDALLAFDFDGTLAPIVAHPRDARVPLKTANCLGRLAQRRPVAVLTGRSLADVRPRLGFEPQYIVGNHGAEDPSDDRSVQWDAVLAGVRPQLSGHAGVLAAAGVSVEDKGSSITLHYRLAPDATQALRCIGEALQGLDPRLRLVGGKCVINIVAAGAPDKGTALMALLRRARAGAAVFIGDDLNDEAVFVAAPPHWMTVRVGPSPGPSAARFHLRGVTQVASFLQLMLRELEKPQ